MLFWRLLALPKPFARIKNRTKAFCKNQQWHHWEIIRKTYEHHKKNDWENDGNVWADFMEQLLKRYAQKLRRIILRQFELITFRFAHGRTLKPPIPMISGFLDVSLRPQTNYVFFGDPRIPQKVQKKNPNHF